MDEALMHGMEPHDEIEYWRARATGAERQLDAQNAAIEDLNTQCRFWRQAAEHAVEGWNKLEDKHDAALDALKAACEGWRGLWESDYNDPAPGELETLEQVLAKMKDHDEPATP